MQRSPQQDRLAYMARRVRSAARVATKLISISITLDVVACALICCSKQPDDFTFNLAPGFHGEVRIVCDPTKGIHVPSTVGRFEILVPSTGVVILDSLKPFESFHKEEFLDSRGNLLKDELTPEVSGVPQVYGLGYRDRGTGEIGYFIGTPAEFTSFGGFAGF